MEKLPDDVLSNILIRLLAKHLARMRCVSKPWNALLTQPSFVKSHLNRAIKNNNRNGIVLYFQDKFLFNMPFLSFSCRTPCCLNTDFILKTPSNAPSGNGNAIVSSVIGSVNGLVCFVHQSTPTPRIYIWNPSLSALLPLPPYTIPSSLQGYDVMFRFGFDPKTDDYKVVKFTFTLQTNIHLVVKEWLQVEVYSMRKGSWNIITQRVPSHGTWIYDEDQVCVDGHDGHLHWLGYIDKKMKQQTIVTFDLHFETFNVISFPDEIVDSNVDGRNVVGVLDGKLCVMSYITNDDIEVWVMNETGVAESWMKHQLFSQFISTTTPYASMEYNEFLFDSRYKHLALYDSFVAKVKSSNLKGSDYYKNTKLVQYVDSLVWIAPTKSLSAAATTIDCKFENCTQKAVKKSSKGGSSTLRNMYAVSEEGNSEIYDDDDDGDDDDNDDGDDDDNDDDNDDGDDDDNDDGDDDHDMDDLNELKTSLSNTSI